jgi:hypothetical protein
MNIHSIRCQQQQKTKALPPRHSTIEEQTMFWQQTIQPRGLLLLDELAALVEETAPENRDEALRIIEKLFDVFCRHTQMGADSDTSLAQRWSFCQLLREKSATGKLVN